MKSLVDDVGTKLCDLSTERLVAMLELPLGSSQWQDCPYSILDLFTAISAELEKRIA